VHKLNQLLQGKNVFANAIHPGYVATNLTNTVQHTSGRFLQALIDFGANYVAYDVTRGTITQLFAATSPAIEVRQGAHTLSFSPLGRCCFVAHYDSCYNMMEGAKHPRQVHGPAGGC
jgi:hypothetical protein